MNSGFFGFPNILGLLRATAFRALGKPGATAGAELAGGTTSGAPTTGEHVLGELVVDHSGTLWICTGAGTPGTWTQVVGGSGSYTLPDATTTTTGGATIEQAPPSGHPRALSTMSRGVANGLASVDTDGMTSSMSLPLLGEATGVVAESARWVQSGSNPLFGGATSAAAQEPNVIAEGGVLKMWYTHKAGAGQTARLAYATSTDGVTWSGHTDVLGAGIGGYSGWLAHTSVTKIDGLYHLYVADDNNGNLLHTQSTDGTTWTTPTIVISKTAAAWSDGWNNSYVWQEGATWYMLLEAGDSATGLFLLCLATSPDGLTWTLDSHHALSSLRPGGVGMSGGPWMMSPQKRHGLYHLWYHGSSSAADLPTDLYHATSSDLITWTISNSGSPVLTHSGTGIDQYADPCIVEFGGQTYLYYERVINASSDFRMCLATVPVSVAQLLDGARQLDGVANGVATLNGSAHVTPAQLVAGTNVSIDGTTGAISSTSGFTDPTSMEGDLLYRHSGALTRLGLGAAGTYLGSDGTDPAWSVPIGQASSLLVLLPNPYAFIDDSATDNGQPPDFIMTAAGDVIGVGGL